MRKPGRDVRGVAAIDVLVLLAALSVVAALLYPMWSGRVFRGRVNEAVADVEAISARARTTLELLGRWPAAAAPGTAPPELAGVTVARPTYTLEWTTWEVVDSVLASTDDVGPPAAGDAPPDSVGPPLEPIARTVGAVALHSGEDALLAELIEHFGRDEAFVFDTTWVRLLPERSGAQIPGR